MKVQITLLVVVANLHRETIKEDIITQVKQYITNLLESVTEAGDKWYEHEPKSILENGDYKILWDFSIQADHVMEAWRLNLVVVDKKRRT